MPIYEVLRLQINKNFKYKTIWEKKHYKYVLYRNKINSIDGKIVNSGIAKKALTKRELVSELNHLYEIPSTGGLKYDGRCGLYSIYKTKPNKKGVYFVLHIDRGNHI